MEMEIVFPGEKQVDALVGNLRIVTDQNGTAPQPFTLFLASIGTCAGIYVVNFCRHRNLPTDGIKIVQRTERNPVTHMIETLDLEIVVPPDFPEKYHQALIRAADQCAVKKHLEQPPAIAVRTVVSAA